MALTTLPPVWIMSLNRLSFFLEVTPKSDIQLWMRYLHILHIFKAYYILEQECKPDCDTMVPSQNLLVIVLLSIISTSSGKCMKGEAKSICLPNNYVKVSFAGLCCCLREGFNWNKKKELRIFITLVQTPPHPKG